MERMHAHLLAIRGKIKNCLIGDDELGAARWQAQLGARLTAADMSDAGYEIDFLDEGPPIKVDHYDRSRHECEMFRLGEAADETDLGMAVVAYRCNVEVAMAVNLGRRIEADV